MRLRLTSNWCAYRVQVARSVLVGAGRNVPFVLSIPTREGGAALSRPVCQAGTLRKRVSRIRDTSSRVTHLTAEDAVEAGSLCPVARWL